MRSTSHRPLLPCIPAPRSALPACLTLLVVLLAVVAAEPVHAAGKFPRFASLSSDEVNVRSGPGTRYPIRWVYTRRNLPVEIVDEYGNWRQIRDMDGETGWLHFGLLSGKRMALIRNAEQTLRHNPDKNSPAVLIAQPSVIGRLLRCTRTWCYMEVAGHKGWLEKSYFFGAYAEEKF